ncbi:RDD family protein [Streptomyces actuosus]|uniref:RDD family protein n=1 Tax=Streptomyces actuosus TaxID=1885 RepID=A0ABS2VHY3_STRAS|nr:RDD family protein [Streptomyces actuosus]MBN0042681.1 RDD family protein [Streptomyces actuosus]
MRASAATGPSWGDPPEWSGGTMFGVIIRRVGARMVDGVFVMLPTVLLGWTAVPLMESVLTYQARRLLRRGGSRIVSSGLDGQVIKDSARESVVVLAKTGSAFLVALTLFAMGFWLVYDWLAHAAFGRTLGKAVFGLEVVRFDGAKPGVLCGLIRAAVLIGAPAATVLYGWAYAMAGRTDEPLVLLVMRWVILVGLLPALLPTNRALHDWLSLTRVHSTR